MNMRVARRQIKTSEWSYGDSTFYPSRYSLYETKLWSPSRDHATTEYSPVASFQELTHIECSEELVAHQKASKRALDEGAVSENTDLLNNGWMKYTSTTLGKPDIAVTLVLESKSADLENIPMHCHKEFVCSTNTDDEISVTISYTSDENEIDSEEETNVNFSKDTGFTSQERSLQKNDFSLTHDFPFRDVRAFVSDDDGTAYNESTYGIVQHSRRNVDYSNCSFKSKIVGTSELAGAYYESNRPHKPQNQLTLSQPNSNDSIVKPVAGNKP